MLTIIQVIWSSFCWWFRIWKFIKQQIANSVFYLKLTWVMLSDTWSCWNGWLKVVCLTVIFYLCRWHSLPPSAGNFAPANLIQLRCYIYVPLGKFSQMKWLWLAIASKMMWVSPPPKLSAIIDWFFLHHLLSIQEKRLGIMTYERKVPIVGRWREEEFKCYHCT